VTGVSLMALDEGLDTGPVYETVAVPVDGADLPTLAWRLVEAGTELLVHALAGGVAGLPAPVPQQGDATYAEKLSPSDFELHFDAPTDELLRLVRLGRAWTRLGGRRLRVLAAEEHPRRRRRQGHSRASWSVPPMARWPSSRCSPRGAGPCAQPTGGAGFGPTGASCWATATIGWVMTTGAPARHAGEPGALKIAPSILSADFGSLARRSARCRASPNGSTST